MGGPAVENETPFAVEPLFLADEEMRPLLVPLIKATYAVTDRGLELAAEQAPPLLAGEFWGKPDESSYRYEPECAFDKPATDVALVGSAVAPRKGTTEMLVGFQVGPVQKGVRVVGDRVWFKTLGNVSMTHPLPFERVPLQWERAFGGWDRSAPDPRHHTFEPRNPVGQSFRGRHGAFEEGLPLPNIEDPIEPLRSFGQRVPPAGFGFVSPHWEPRLRYAGTYDEAWQKERAPLLPKDFDRRFLNAAAPGLVVPGYLRGDEQVIASGVTASGRLAFRLPGVEAPEVLVVRRGLPDISGRTRLDTVIVDTDALAVYLLWRCSVPLRDPTGAEVVRVRAGVVS